MSEYVAHEIPNAMLTKIGSFNRFKSKKSTILLLLKCDRWIKRNIFSIARRSPRREKKKQNDHLLDGKTTTVC